MSGPEGETTRAQFFPQEWMLETCVALVHSQRIFINVDRIFYMHVCFEKWSFKVLFKLFLAYLQTLGHAKSHQPPGAQWII